MRVKRTKPLATRIVRRFLLFPRAIGDEIRWLEVARIKQQFVHGYWLDLCWIDESEE